MTRSGPDEDLAPPVDPSEVVLELPDKGTGARSARRRARRRATLLPTPFVSGDDVSDEQDDASDEGAVEQPLTTAAEALEEEPETALEPASSRSRLPLIEHFRRPTVVSPPPAKPLWRRVLFVVLLVGLLGTGAGLLWVGVETVRDSTEGEFVDVTDDPSAPGFEALVTPTPTLLLIDHQDEIADGFTFLSLGGGDEGGSVVFIPVRTIAEIPVFGEQPAELAYEGGGPEPATETIQNLLGVGIINTVEIDNPRWTALVEPVAPLTIDNPDDVVVTDPETGETGLLFPAGEIQLEADAVGQYLETKSENEVGDLARLERNRVFWQAWLAAIAERVDEPDIVPGETDVGIGRFARGLAAGNIDISTLPVDEVETDLDDKGLAYEPRDEQVDALVTTAVPLPTSPAPGVRPEVRLLNGTSDPDLLGTMVPTLVEAGAAIAVFGNADSFSEEHTRITFFDTSFAPDARRFRDALGVGELIREDRPIEVADITIVVGTDYLDGAQ